MRRSQFQSAKAINSQIAPSLQPRLGLIEGLPHYDHVELALHRHGLQQTRRKLLHYHQRNQKDRWPFLGSDQ